MVREIVYIDEKKCNGCGLCVPNCHEGALQIIDGKAVLISDLLCDGLGACVGHCPKGAITIEKREASQYDETRVMSEMVKKTKNVVIAHLKHLKDHNEFAYLEQGIKYLQEHQSELDFEITEIINEVMETNKGNVNLHMHTNGGGCPGSRSMSFGNIKVHQKVNTAIQSALTHWPIQLHLINPAASHFMKCDLLIAADCTAFTIGNFHNELLINKKLAIACPKLDSNKEIYVEKIKRLIDESKVNTITVAIMEVPCCGGLLQLVHMALNQSSRKIPVKQVVISIQGEILDESWI